MKYRTNPKLWQKIIKKYKFMDIGSCGYKWTNIKSKLANKEYKNKGGKYISLCELNYK